MSEADPASARWRIKDLLLAELVVGTLLLALLVAIWGAGALPWTTAAEREGKAYRDSAAAAERAVLAFLDVDYRDLDGRVKAVIKLSTGAFKDEYTRGWTDLRIATLRVRSVSTGTIRAVAVKDIDGSVARVLVGADSVIRTKDGTTKNRYRFLVTLRNVDGTWLMADLAEVP